MIPVYYDASNLEADVDVFDIISELVDEKETWNQYLNATEVFEDGVYIENFISPFSIPSMGQDFLYDCCLIELVTTKEDLLNKGYLEEAILKDAITYHGCISILTAIALETIMYSRQAVANKDTCEV